MSTTPRETRNGINKPLRGLCLNLWEAIDKIPGEVTSKHVAALAKEFNSRPAYVGIVLSQVKTFNGDKAAKKVIKATPAKSTASKPPSSTSRAVSTRKTSAAEYYSEQFTPL